MVGANDALSHRPAEAASVSLGPWPRLLGLLLAGILAAALVPAAVAQAAFNYPSAEFTTSSTGAPTHVYWANFDADTIGRARIDGLGANQSFIPGASDPNGVAVDDTHIYWANFDTNTIGRANLDGTGANQSFISGAGGPTGVAVDGTHVYWANWGTGTIGRANLDGTGANHSFITGASDPHDVAVDGTHIYWTNRDLAANTIGRANLNGTGANQSFITGASSPTGVAVDGAHVYWTNFGTGTIGRANLDGTGANQSFITGANSPTGVALGAGAPPEPGTSPGSIDFGSVFDGQASGPRTVTVTNLGGGTLGTGKATLAGSDLGDFEIIADGCDGEALEGTDECEIELRFTPGSAGTKEANLEVPHDAGSPATVPLTGLARPPPTNVYWANLGVNAKAIARASIDGTGADQSFIPGASDPHGVAVDGAHVYWTNWGDGTIGRANLDGNGANQSFITGANGPNGVAVDGTHIYWANFDTNTIGRANLNGTDPDQSFITTGAQAPWGVALGAGADPPEPKISPESIDFGAVITGQDSATETATLTNTGGGTLNVGEAALAGADPGEFEIVTDGCDGEALGAGQDCQVNLRFSPTSVSAKEATLEVPHDTAGSPAEVALKGQGAAPPPPGDDPPTPPAPPDSLNLPAKLEINRAQVRVGASAAGRHGVRRLVVRGSLDPRAADERVMVSFRARGRQIVMRPTVQENGSFQVNRRLRGPQRRAAGGQLQVRYAGNAILRAVAERLRAARRAAGLRIARLALRGNRLVVAGRVLPRARRQARIEVKFNRPDGSLAQLATQARVNRRGRFRTRLQVPPAVRNLGAWVSLTHPGRARLFGQRRGRAFGG